MVYLSEKKEPKKKNGNARAAKTNSQGSNSNADPNQAVAKSPDEANSQENAFQPLIEVPKLTPGQMEAAKTFNFPLDKLFNGLERINAFYMLHTKQMEEIHNAFKKLDEILPTLQQRTLPTQTTTTQPQQAPGQGVNLGELIKEGSKLLKGESEDTLLNTQLKQMMIDSFKSKISFSDTFEKITLAKMAGKTSKDIGELLGI